jgi:hypothetical protein
VEKLTVKEVQNLGREIVLATPGGIRYANLAEDIAKRSPETPPNTIRGAIWNLDELFSNEISKPTRGLFTSLAISESDTLDVGSTEQIGASGAKVQESDFYDPFAKWLIEDLNEATTATSLGGSGLKSKWGTPDVIGTYKPLAKDLITFPIEIISAEIKIDPITPVVAFGQAIAYRLFSTKAYIAMPTTMTEEDKARLESLCMLFGVGLVLFELDKENPQFDIRVRAQRFSPDMFYVNDLADRLKRHNASIFHDLFSLTRSP